MSKLNTLTVHETLDGLNKKEFSAVELAEEYIKEAEAARRLNAYVLETPEAALSKAAESDQRYAAGNPRPLEGIPLGIKDLFCTEGIRTTACSHILDGFIPPYESTVTARLFDAGASCLGKLNMDEFAMGGSNETSYYGPVVNPWKAEKKLVPGGSIRQPAAFCGVSGIKPTYGRCSRYGIMAFASSLDQAGPIAKDVRDCALLLNVMAGYDAKDSTSVKMDVPDFTKVLGQSVKGLKVGIPAEYRPAGLNPEIAAYWDKGIEMLKNAGAEIVDISLPHTKYALAVYYIIAPAEASSNLARYDGLRYGLRVPGEHLDDMYVNTRTAGFGTEVKRRVMIGTYVLSAGYYDAYYLKAQKVRRLIRDDFMRAFERCDVILTPTAPSAAFAIGDKSMTDDPINMWLNDVFTVSVNLAGLPAMSLPIGLSGDGLPLGLQVIGRAFDEETVFKTAAVIEKEAKFERLK